MRTLLFIFILSGLFSIIKAQSNEEQQAIALADEQLKAYNARDVEAFLKPYSDTIKVYRYPNTLLYQGKKTMRQEYTEMFKQLPDLYCKLVNRITLGNTVIDREEVIFRKDQAPFHAIAIYKIAGGKIVEVTFIQ
ncbi:MAG: nuclear transport factor 2 family protein [Microscillaceae bacterium]|nr:nuclear transport factor 2 family protein [Microscillaceae bacterium]